MRRSLPPKPVIDVFDALNLKLTATNDSNVFLQEKPSATAATHLSTVAMIVVGLTGGIATGKSTVTSLLRKQQVTVIDCDEIAHAVVSKASDKCSLQSQKDA